MRVTDSETMDVVEMVLGGQVNKEVVELINQAGGKAVGLTGQDGAFIRARKMLLPSKENGHIDLGQVGEIDSIDPAVIQALEAGGFIPVVAPIGTGSDGIDRKSTRLNSSHRCISYAVFCLKKKKKENKKRTR